MYSIVILLSMSTLIISGRRNVKTPTKYPKRNKTIWTSSKNNESSKIFTNMWNSLPRCMIPITDPVDSYGIRSDSTQDPASYKKIETLPNLWKKAPYLNIKQIENGKKYRKALRNDPPEHLATLYRAGHQPIFFDFLLKLNYHAE